MDGDVTAFFNTLTNTPSQFTLSKSGLSPQNQNLLGVYYHAKGDYTYLGVPAPESQGILIFVQ
jgi:hypothetical protein